MSQPASRVRRRLGDLLVEAGQLQPQQLTQALEEQKKWGGKLGRILVDFGMVTEEQVHEALARQLGLPYADPAVTELEDEKVRLVGVQVCERFGVIAIDGDEARRWVRLAVSDPGNSRDLEEIAKIIGFQVQVAIATPASIDKAIRRFYYGEGPNAVPVSRQLSQAPAGFQPSQVGKFKQAEEAAENVARAMAMPMGQPMAPPGGWAPQWPPPNAMMAPMPVAPMPMPPGAPMPMPMPMPAMMPVPPGVVPAQQAMMTSTGQLVAVSLPPVPAPQPPAPVAPVAPRPPPAAAAPSPSIATPPAREAAQLAALQERIDRLERASVATATVLKELAAKVDRLEKVATTEASVLRAMLEVMLEKNLVTREEYAARLRRAQAG